MLSRRAKLEKRLGDQAYNIRKNIIKMLTLAGSGHTAGSLGVVDILTVLYFNVLRYSHLDHNSPDRDLFILSAGHLCPALYAVLAEAGFIDIKELASLRKFGSRLQGHPERTSLPFVNTTSGPLGSGLSQASGMAYTLKYLEPNNNRKVFTLVGDGEMNEGNIWEALMFAGKNKLDNLVLIIDNNDIQLSGKTSDIMPLAPFAPKLQSFGWQTYNVDGNSIGDLIEVFDLAKKTVHKPVAIIAKTIPGKGVSFMEGDYHWHGKVTNEEEAHLALEEMAENASIK